MHIKELVLDDFKSFGRKTRIPFYEDFTTVSGPNGSGKSNIIDSILFALGLARTSGIRAEKLTDLIYNPGHEDDGDAGLAGAGAVRLVLVAGVVDEVRQLLRADSASARESQREEDAVDDVALAGAVRAGDDGEVLVEGDSRLPAEALEVVEY